MRYLKCILIMLVVIVMMVTLCSCSSSSKLVGNWVCEEVHSGYPDQMTLYKDGTGVIDGCTCSWKVVDEEIVFNIDHWSITSADFNYSFEGSVLYLDDYAYTKE